MATFSMIPEEEESFHLLQEIPLFLVGFLDLVGIYMMHGRLQRKGSRKPNHLRILAVALGWGCGEAVVFYLIPLWMGARDMEFSWAYIEMGVLSNIKLLLHLATSTAVWLLMRNDLDPVSFIIVGGVSISQMLLPTICNYMKLSLKQASSVILGLRFGVAVVLLGLAWINFRLYSRKLQKNTYSKRD
eukprot:CAMPEP_0197532646 /NCGR_PEP_ID=MMETSP1318-20131121/40478_1 /TAXON_ID=552666 /ORGANISM="Partenskyella glossopodia, Strain RCC365" /LENGTH=186 /DNA_ID=CAMNT_0043089281 /DNA_START=186 /DNA_END=746 /DNA_ORIENTATION=+